MLSVSAVEHTYRGIPLSSRVEGARALFGEGTIEISPGDASDAGVSEGGKVRVSGEGFEISCSALISGDQALGWLHAVLAEPRSVPCNPCPVSLERYDV